MRCKFIERHDAFGFVTEVNQNAAIGNINHFALHRLAGMISRLFLLVLFQNRAEINFTGRLRFGFRRAFLTGLRRFRFGLGGFGCFGLPGR